MSEMASKTLDGFWHALGDQQAYFEPPTVPYEDPIFCLRTKPGFIFDDSFWEVFQAHPLIICHLAYYGPERLEGGDRQSDEGIFELRFAFTGTRLQKCPIIAAKNQDTRAIRDAATAMLLALPDVQSVRVYEEYDVTVEATITGDHYEDAQMDRLLDAECRFLGEHPDCDLSFRYIPAALAAEESPTA